jgi:glycine oxidase
MIDCIVVGGGLLGMLTARYLHEGGAKVLLIERGQLGNESSWAGGGILSPLYPWRYSPAVTHLATISQKLYSRFAEDLSRETGIDPEWTNSGLLILDSNETETALAWAQQNGASLEYLQGTAVRECEPSLATHFNEALWMPAIAQIRNPRLVKALRASLTMRGIPYHEHEKVIELVIQDGAVKGARSSHRRYSADRVLISAGAWSAQLGLQNSQVPSIEPVQGQMIAYQAEPQLLQRIVLYKGRYLIPRRDGHLLAGSTLEYVGFNKATSTEARNALHNAALELVPAIARYPIKYHWCGLRPGSPEGIPTIGESADTKGLFYNCGHFRNGIVLGLSSARLAADLVLGKTPQVSPTPYALVGSQ